MTTTENQPVSYLEQLKSRCPFPLPFDRSSRRPVDHLHTEAAALANPGENDTPLDTLHAARWLQDTVDKVMRQLVDDSRSAGATWQQVGEALGVTRQAAQMRFGK